MDIFVLFLQSIGLAAQVFTTEYSLCRLRGTIVKTLATPYVSYNEFEIV